MAELERIDLRLRLQVVRMRQRNGLSPDDEFRGLYISEEEIDALIANDASQTNSVDSGNSPQAAALSKLEEEIAARKAESLASGVNLRLCELADLFGLNDFEIDTLLICLLPEIDTKYERLFGYLHDDVTRKRASVSLVLQCLLERLDERIMARRAFLPRSPLMVNHFLRMEDDSSAKSPPLLVREIKIEDRIAGYLMGSDQADSRLSAFTCLNHPGISLGDMVLSDTTHRQLMTLASDSFDDSARVTLMEGIGGTGKKSAAEALCRSWNLPLLMVNTANLLAEGGSLTTFYELIFREAKLQRSALCWERFDLLLSEDRNLKPGSETFIRGLNDFRLPVFITSEKAWHPGSALGDKAFVHIEFDLPSYANRKQLWEVYLNGQAAKETETEMDEVSDKFRFTPGQIKDASATAQYLASSRGERISTPDLYTACRVTSNQRLGNLARKIQPKYTWQDIVLPADQMAQLNEIADHVKYRHVVFSEWNFEKKVSLGKGMNVLFAGPSGTGKTMAAEIVAHELGLDLYKIDLSTVVSKYIGETEKNLDRIFTEAQGSNAILFFDEADAIFGKRSEVKDSHDRYANIEIAYLLQKMEEYEGISILATNLRKNLDEAFARRMHFSIEFPLPEEPDRLSIWRGVFPEEAPVADNVDLQFMARQFRVTGGNIKNIAFAAAFLSASDGGTIGIEHLIRATRREYQKMGRLCTESDFGPYFDLVRGEQEVS